MPYLDYQYHTTPQTDAVLTQLIEVVRKKGARSPQELAAFLNHANKGLRADEAHVSKKLLIPRYMEIKHSEHAQDIQTWQSWSMTDELERALLSTLRIKPRRTSSGVATITILTKPWPCSSACIFCPNDIRMPKSYMANEPACQRAEQCLFDPFLQTSLRLLALMNMGHPTDKVEVIILGGTWSEYPKTYQCWFVHEVFRALNLGYSAHNERVLRAQMYERLGFSLDVSVREKLYKDVQRDIDEGHTSYNEAFAAQYATDPAWQNLADIQSSTLKDVFAMQKENEHAHHRVVGLVIETRPDTITADNLTLMRALGATKVQMGIQVLNQEIRALNHRRGTREDIDRAFELLRLFGFKIHVHAMVNLLGSTPELDKKDFCELTQDTRYKPDEIKLYPCVLVESACLSRLYAQGNWQAYTEKELVDVLVSDVLATPSFTRISRMIRDISSTDIIAGNKKPNLRQLVEDEIARRVTLDTRIEPHEIRIREIAGRTLDPSELRMVEVPYTTSVSDEYFLQWVDAQNHIAGFLRLSLPYETSINRYGDKLPIHLGEAMIREVHIYGTSALVQKDDVGTAQHHGLGKKLIEHACMLARNRGYRKINVISAVGTRNYYRKLGFSDNGLYQQKLLNQDK